MSLENLLHIYERSNTTSPQSPENRYRGITSYIIDALFSMWKIPKNQQQKKIRNENMDTARFQNTKLTYKSQPLSYISAMHN